MSLSPAGADPAAAGPSCSLCREEIEGPYTLFEAVDLSVCGTCIEAPACAGCGLPRAGRNAGEGDHCARCRSSADRCSSCGRPILDRYWTVHETDGRYCVRCVDQAPKCGACNAPATDGTMRDGRFFCRACRDGIVEDDGTYHDLYARMVARTRDVLGLELERVPTLVVESNHGLQSEHAETAPREGLCGLYQRDAAGNTTIHVLSHLTPERVAAVLAHELAHAWQAENCPDEQGLRLREGFAEWVAWRALEGLPGHEAERRMITRRTDEYGLGFRVFAGLDARGGPAHALWYARAVRGE